MDVGSFYGEDLIFGFIDIPIGGRSNEVPFCSFFQDPAIASRQIHCDFLLQFEGISRGYYNFELRGDLFDIDHVECTGTQGQKTIAINKGFNAFISIPV